MALLIIPDCINCVVCQFECRNDAISQRDGIHFIDPEKCTECDGIAEKPRCVSVCAVDCIVPDPQHPYHAARLSA